MESKSFPFNLKRIRLYGKKNIDVKLNENTLILVGENGSGKTTFLRILFYILSGRWVPLVQNKFEKIVATIDGKEYVVKHKELTKNFENIDRRLLTNLPAPIRKKMIELIEVGQVDQVPFELRRMCDQYGMSIELIMRQLEVLEETSKVRKKESY
ncbi:MAG: ATP-binding cassette domain-containing protein, partial [Alphaproteobacteria bacterium]